MTSPRDGTNYYEILEVSVEAPQHEIHRAYQRAKSTYSQDNPALYSMFSRDEARELMKLIEEAYSVLGNQSLRRSYDERLIRGNHAPPVNNNNLQVEQNVQMPNPIQVQAPSAKINSQLPPGTGRTVISTYTIDENFEHEIETRTEFDGAFIQKVRQYKNIPLDLLSENIRISRTYIIAIENQNFSALPAAVFVRGFIIQLAKVLGLDPQKVANSYMRLFKVSAGKTN